MRDCIFLLADKNMEATFNGFLTREKFYLSLKISNFEFDPSQDLIVDESGSDPGVYSCFSDSHIYTNINYLLSLSWYHVPDKQCYKLLACAYILAS